MSTIPVFILLLMSVQAAAQIPSSSPASGTNQSVTHVIEGGKVVVELIRLFSSKKEDREPGCKSGFADMCVVNYMPATLTVTMVHRRTGERREVVILPSGKECTLQAGIGVWTYELFVPGQTTPIRKGDILLEACAKMEMRIK